MPEVYLNSKDEWVPCDIVKSNSKTYILKIKGTETINTPLKIKDGKTIIKKEEVIKEQYITKKKARVRL